MRSVSRCLRFGGPLCMLLLVTLAAMPDRAVGAVGHARVARPAQVRATRLLRPRTGRPTPVRTELAAARHNPVLARHWARLSTLDRLLGRFHAVKEGGVRIQLTGSTLYQTVAALDRGTRPSFTDIDLRVAGLDVDAVLAEVRRVYPQVDVARDVEVAPSYTRDVKHVQVTVRFARGPPMQLDLSIYPDAAGAPLDRPHQWVSFAKLKLEVPRTRSVIGLLHRACRRATAVRLAELRDPGRTGVRDLTDGWIRVTPEAGMPTERLLEGLLHSMYLVNRYPAMRVHPDTIAMFRHMRARQVRAFFDVADAEVGNARASYILSAFRPGRDMERALELGRVTGFWGKLFPSLRPVLSDDVAWERTKRTVARAREAITASGVTSVGEDRLGRARLLGTLFGEVTDGHAVTRDVEGLRWGRDAAGARRVTYEIIAGYEAAHAR